MTNPIKILFLNRRRRALDDESDDAAAIAYFRGVKADLDAHAGEPLGAGAPTAVSAAPEESGVLVLEAAASTEPMPFLSDDHKTRGN